MAINEKACNQLQAFAVSVGLLFSNLECAMEDGEII